MAATVPLTKRNKPGLTAAELDARDNVIEQIGLLQARVREAGAIPWGPNSVLRMKRSNLRNMTPQEVIGVRNSLRQWIIKNKAPRRDY